MTAKTRASRPKPRASEKTRPTSTSPSSITTLAPARALAIPFAFTAALGAFAFFPGVGQNARLLWSFGGACTALLAWNAALLLHAPRRGRTFALEVVVRPQHYLQACAQGSVLLYWGWYWQPVYDYAPLIAAQLAFAYAVDMLLTWSRRETYALGFGPFPIIFSINLFLWFKLDWFYLQFLLVAVGLFAKELIRWDKDGRRAHIFNPSSFPLALCSMVLILTQTTHLTWGEEIATTQFLPPHIYLVIFLVGLPGQLLFGVTSMTMSAAVTTYGFGLLYFAATGTYYFFDSYIPIAVFLGMHLLFTDPSTSPRTESGRVVFGVLYGLGTVALYTMLGLFGAPTFYDKLLPVPILNLVIRSIDRAARSEALARFDPALMGRALAPRQRHLGYISIWAVVFILMSVAQGVGDMHPGHQLPFWRQACEDGRRHGCSNLAIIESRYCAAGSAWACNELGILAGTAPGASPIPSAASFGRACFLGFQVGCANAKSASSGSKEFRSAPPRQGDYAIALGEGKGPLPAMTAPALYERACDQGWGSGCDELAGVYMVGRALPRDTPRAVQLLEKGCSLGEGSACSNLGLMYRRGDGVPRDDTRALQYLRKACDAGFPEACQWLEDERRAINK